MAPVPRPTTEANPAPQLAGGSPVLTVIMVSYNTRELTLTALATLIANTPGIGMQLIVVDNASDDGSSEAVAERFPEVELIASDSNLGFAAANNVAAERAQGEWLLLLNPDTETFAGSIASMLDFSRSHPEAGIVGGRTLYPDGTLNPFSCANRMTAWSLFCGATGLSRAFPSSPIFNSEQMGGWQRDTVRHVDIVVGCFFLVRRELWQELGGFDTRYFMYGEEADFCLRAAHLGYRPMITPDAEIMHVVGASSTRREDKLIPLMRAKASLVRGHWHKMAVPLGISLLWLWAVLRKLASTAGLDRQNRPLWTAVWRRRHEWLAGY